MAPTKKHHIHVLLLLLMCYYSVDVAARHNTTVPCLPDQASSLLQLKRSFIDVDANLASWQDGKDCCHWEGVTCDIASGRVVSLDLGGFNLRSRRLDPALFKLTSLRNLSLGNNDFGFAKLPSSGLERLTDIIHLNFSHSQFSGQIPIGIARLKNLVTLDFTFNYCMYLREPNFQAFMANLSNLRELHLGSVDISSSGSTWSVVLADSVPQLQILSLIGCGIFGPIDPTFSRLRSLTTIDLRQNEGLTGKVPEFFAEFSSLSILYISSNSFSGQFPTKIFQMKSLRMLDLSWNPNLSACLPDFLVGSNLETLNLAGVNLCGDIAASLISLKCLNTLGISTAQISKGLSLIHNLPLLSQLEFHGRSLEKPILSWVGNLKQLTSLELHGYDFTPSVPSWIGNLSSLASLEINECNFAEPIPYQIGNLANLTRLDFSGCNHTGQQIPSWIGNLTKLTELVLGSCNFSGQIPSTIGNLTQLKILNLRNNHLAGKIPKSLFTLPALRALYLDSNKLSGPLEEVPAPSSSPLYVIWLYSNELTGPIPKSIFELQHLEGLSLESNKFSGRVELASFWRLKSLFWLSLSNNMLSIVDEDDDILPSLPIIEHLFLASCNLTKLPSVLRYLDKISDLDLSSNQINGVIPRWVWENWKDQLDILDLSHNMFTALEKSSSLVYMPQLTFLNLSFNRLQGSIPVQITPYASAPYFLYHGVVLDYSNNNFSSMVPNFGRYIDNAIYLDLSKNNLNGHIPSSICSASKLIIMDLSYNNLSGSVPSCLVKRGELRVLKLRENRFHGMLPGNIKEGCKFETLDLNGNGIEGQLPRSLSNCQDLQLLDVGNNQIVDSFPSWLGVLPQLRVLILRSNQLNGTINDIKGHHRINSYFRSLQVLDLASNSLSGNLPKGWFNELKAMMENVNTKGQVIGHETNLPNGFYRDTVIITFKGGDITYTKILTALKTIDFSNNSFDGPVPESIGRLVSLHGLNMSYNNFTGQIPYQFGKLSQLESLDLSWNQLSGEIPQDLTSLTSLEWLNLSYNSLSGRIPQGNQFLTIPNSSFEGNIGLCGRPLSRECDTPHSIAPNAVSSPDSGGLWEDKLGVILLFAFVGLGFGVGFALSFLLQVFCRTEGWGCKR